MQPPSVPPKALRTMVAMQAFDAADGFNDALDGVIPGWTAELSAPGISTGGGKRAVEHVTLSNEGRTVVVGSVDFGARKVELRSHPRVREAYFERYGIALHVSPTQYDVFLAAVGAFFKRQAFTVQKKSADQATVPPEEPTPGRFPWLVLLLGLVVIAVVGAVVWYFVLRTPPPQPVPGVWLSPAAQSAWPATSIPWPASTSAWPATATAWPATSLPP